MQKVNTIIVTCLMCILFISFSARAELIDRGGGLIYDTDQNITWLQNASMFWGAQAYTAQTWAWNLSYYDSVRNVTRADWRLPSAYNHDGSGITETGGEMGYLYQTYGITFGTPGPFTGLNHNTGVYSSFWTGTQAQSSGYAYAFCFPCGGKQWGWDTGYHLYAMAVMDGDVGPAPIVPEPISSILFLTGGATLIGRKYLRRKKEV